MDKREQMNIVIVGHVDHGKSTVIGRLLADTGALPEGKLEAVKAYCRKNSRPFEYAFLLDALKDEQAQGITIDTARCFFKTRQRDYIIIDAPGHIEFLKNMVTGASRAEAALLVIDAQEGIQENSKRHGHIVSTLGVKQVVVLVNKMDLVDFDERVFNHIKAEFSEYLNKINIKPVNFIPISAFYGENIADKSSRTSWYTGPTVLEQLDGFAHKGVSRQLPFRMPVQDIYKFTAQGDNRRIVAGTVLSGTISTGDEVIFLPSNKRSVIKNIEGFNVQPKSTAYADEALGVTLTTQIYIKPGELMVKAKETKPTVSSSFRANVFWVGKTPLIKNKTYKLKIGAMRIGVKLLEIAKIIDAAELDIDTLKDQVERHDAAECIFETARPIAFDDISAIEQTGRFVIVDNYEISGGGIIIEGFSTAEHAWLEHSEDNAFLWEKSSLSAAERARAFGHKARFIVLTSGSEGNDKVIQEIARELENKLIKMQYKAFYLGISAADSAAREEQIRQLGQLSRLFTESGQIFITSIFNLNDAEAEKLRLLHQPCEAVIINTGESPLNFIQPDTQIKIDVPAAAASYLISLLMDEPSNLIKAIPY